VQMNDLKIPLGDNVNDVMMGSHGMAASNTKM
jgi:hypothetical protein